MRALITMVLAVMFSTSANAEGMFRFGAGVGQVTVEADDAPLKGNDFGWEIFAGYEANENWAIEVGYIDGGTADDTFETFFSQQATIEADQKAFVASVIGSIQLGDRFSFYARGGLMHWESDQSITVNGAVVEADDFDGDDPFFGIGGAANVESALVRLEYRLADLDDSDLSFLSLAIAWRF